jgi:hypothetical protein
MPINVSQCQQLSVSKDLSKNVVLLSKAAHVSNSRVVPGRSVRHFDVEGSGHES